MIKRILTYISIIATILSMNSCGKPNTPQPPTTSNKCFLVSETVNGGPGYGTSWVYQYDAEGHLLKGNNPPIGGVAKDGQLAVSGNIIGIAFSGSPYGDASAVLKFVYAYVGDLKGGTPSSGSQDFTSENKVTYPKYEEYIFGYDTKKRMIESAIKAGTINMQYDDKDNLVGMVFIANNGPRVISPLVTIDAYDDKPSPYAADPKIWIFTQQMRSWSYFNEYRTVSALSKNNPGRITTEYPGYPTSRTVDTIIYQYNDKGMPTLATVKRTYRGSTTTYQSNFYGYDCK